MDYNLLNGGLILKVGEGLVVSDIKSSTTIFNSRVNGMFWFMNFDGNSIFYSDQKRDNSLNRIDLREQREILLLDKPCYGVVLYKDFLYYINENDRKLYRCMINGRNEARIIDEQVEGFILEQGCIFYSTPQGIRSCSETGSQRETISDIPASKLVLIGERLVFSHKGRQHVLTIMDLNTGNANIVQAVAAASINTDGTYLYCANRLNGKSIYRIDPEHYSSIRICSESADYLHIIEKELYFYANSQWCRMSLMGGQAEKIMR